MSARSRAAWMICPVCKGEGKSSQHLGVVAREDFDDEEWEQYLHGGYDAPCEDCRGTGKVREDEYTTAIVRAGSDGQRVVYADADDASEHHLRMAEGWA